MASGMARGHGRKIAFGDGRKIIWDQHSEIVFRHNPNIVPPGQENAATHWIIYHKGHRNYNRLDVAGDRWVWNYDFKAPRGEVFLNAAERAGGERYGKGFVLIEPAVPQWKSVSVNKDWGRARYQAVADRLVAEDIEVKQFQHVGGAEMLRGAQPIPTFSFRDVLKVMKHAGLYVGPEGGLHHTAAAFNVRGVVIFGGFIPAAVTGYDDHVNLTAGAEACGSLHACAHCRAALDAISVEEVAEAAIAQIRQAAA